MAYSQLPTRTSADANASADINQLQDDIDAILGTEAAAGPAKTLVEKATASGTLTAGKVAECDGTNVVKAGAPAVADLVTMAAVGGTNEFIKTATTDRAASKSGGPGSSAGGYFFTDGGSPAFRVKKLTGTTNGSEGGSTAVAHSLTSTKIILWSVTILTASGVGIHDENTSAAGYNATAYYDGTNFYVVNKAANSSNILSKSFIITVLYEE